VGDPVTTRDLRTIPVRLHAQRPEMTIHSSPFTMPCFSPIKSILYKMKRIGRLVGHASSVTPPFTITRKPKTPGISATNTAQMLIQHKNIYTNLKTYFSA